MNIKKATNSQLSTTESKTNKQKTVKLSKQPEQEQNHRYGDHLEGYQWDEGGGRMWEKVQGLRSTNNTQNCQKIGRYKTDMERLRIVQEMRRQRTDMSDPWT